MLMVYLIGLQRDLLLRFSFSVCIFLISPANTLSGSAVESMQFACREGEGEGEGDVREVNEVVHGGACMYNSGRVI